MTRQTLVLLLIFAACSKGGGTGEPATKAAQDPADAGPSRAEIAANCSGFLDRQFAEIEEVLPEVGVATGSGTKARYHQLGSAFLASCEALPPKTRACLARDGSLHDAIEACDARKTLSDPLALDPPSILPLVSRLDAPPLDEPAREEALARLVGRWRQERDDDVRIEWRIEDSGAVTETRQTGRDVQERRFALRVERPGELAVLLGDGLTEIYSFALAGRRTFYAMPRHGTRVGLISDDTSFMVLADADLIVRKGDSCRVITAHGRSADASCEFTNDRGSRIFEARYEVTDRGKTREENRRFFELDGLLVDERVIVGGRFDKR